MFFPASKLPLKRKELNRNISRAGFIFSFNHVGNVECKKNKIKEGGEFTTEWGGDSILIPVETYLLGHSPKKTYQS